MFKKQDFKKLDLLGSGKKHTKIYKVSHIPTGKYYALKEIEAKNLEKLNEYKEEAVQLSKVQSVGNILKFYGYYFYETMYNTFRLGIVTEFMDHNFNLENLYRRKKKSQNRWAEDDIRTFMFSLIQTCSALQQKGICHRDIKPANLFMLQDCTCKMIDFGESKDYVYDVGDQDKETYTLATIRGTPQYLSPILWKAHVIDGNSRYAKHNIYKSDVFSSGLVIYQLAALKEVTGFNNVTPETQGEELIHRALNELEKLYSKEFVQIIRLMLIFDETKRPSFLEMEYLFMEQEASANDLFHTQSKNSDDESSKCNDLIRIYNKYFNTLVKKANENTVGDLTTTKTNTHTPQSINNSLNMGRINTSIRGGEKENLNNISHISKASNKDIHDYFLDLNNKPTEIKLYWFEFGGKQIARYLPSKNRWKSIDTKPSEPLPEHFTQVYVKHLDAIFLLGGHAEDNFREFSISKELISKRKPMTQVRNFFPAVFSGNRIFVFGGYDNERKSQIKSCQSYDLTSDTWRTISDMNIERSQATAFSYDKENIFVMGGYNKKSGALKSIEQYSVSKNSFRVIELALPEGLRRFSTRKCDNGVLIFGGIKQYFENNSSVYKVDLDVKHITELGTLEKGGCIESEVLFDSDNNFHVFFEELNGTAPPYHSKFWVDDKILAQIGYYE